MLAKDLRVSRIGGLVLILLVALAVSVVSTSAASAQTLTTLVSFDLSDGAGPEYVSLISDANGNLFGTTSAGGEFSYGTVFEIVKTTTGYASAPTTLVSFNGSDGEHPTGALIADANGNLLGTTNSGGASGDGTVFEIVKTTTGYASAPTTLFSFDGSDGQFPVGALIADANGNLFGTTDSGTVFEIVKTMNGYASTPTTLARVNGSPFAGLLADANGNLFGTTYGGGGSSNCNYGGCGTVFEIVKTTTGYASTPTTLVTFDGTDGEILFAGLIADANGNLFGTTYGGGGSSNCNYGGCGTVFEIVKTTTGYASTPTTLVTFNGIHGALPDAGLIADAAGNLFGTTFAGGASSNCNYGGCGTIFEVVKDPNAPTGYASTPITLVSFDLNNGGGPFGLIADANGNLFGATQGGGAYVYYGTVFEVSGSGFLPPKQFAGTPGTANCNGGSTSALANTYGGLAHAAAALGYGSVKDLQNAVAQYCSN